MLRRVRVHICSERHGVAVELFDPEPEDAEDDLADGAEIAPWMGGIGAGMFGGAEEEAPEETEQTEVFCEGRLRTREDVFSLTYRESEQTEMDDATTTLSFRTTTPGLVTILRSGDVSTSMVFEKGRRHTCVYHTPYLTFEICVHTLQVENRLHTDGTLFLDYVVEIRGARAEHCRLTLQVSEMA